MNLENPNPFRPAAAPADFAVKIRKIHARVRATVFVFAAFASMASANDVEPRPGHYETPGKAGRTHVEFDLRKGVIKNLKIDGDHVKIPRDVEVTGRDRFHFPKSSASDGRRHVGEYLGHGRWETNLVCKGDFRFYAPLAPHGDDNEYHHWHAHWVSK